jgi:prepilin-type N-terminal cleavage/methylation domain-containing protein
MKIQHPDPKGFMLIELLVAISLFSLVFTILATGFWGGLEVLKRDTQNQDFFSEHHLFTLNFMQELQNAIPFAPLGLTGDSRGIYLTTRKGYNAAGNSIPGISRIHYWYEGETLYRNEDAASEALKEDAFMKEDTHKTKWLGGLKKFSLGYGTVSAQDHKITWESEWKPAAKKESLPLAVKVELQFKKGNSAETIDKIVYLPEGVKQIPS